jgi:cytochrome c peroxidase
MEKIIMTNQFRPTFNAVYDQYKNRNGQSFTVIRTIDKPDATHDAEVLPMYEIQFPDGEIAQAWPEEVIQPALTDKEMNAIGDEIAEILCMRRDPNYRDRWKTTWGNKTGLGLIHTLQRILKDRNLLHGE